MRRREFLTLLSGAIAMRPPALRAQQSALPIVGFLNLWPLSARSTSVFQDALGEAGFVDGRNVVISYRDANAQSARLPVLASELVDQRVAVIVTAALDAGFAAKAATRTIPIIFTCGSDPTTLTLVRGLIRPDGNIAGVSQVLPPLAPERLKIIRELTPDVVMIGFLDTPHERPSHAQSELSSVSAAAQALGIQIEPLEAQTNGELNDAFAALARQRANALIVSPDPFFISMRPQLTALAKHYAIPTVYPFSEDAEAGGLVSYGNSNFDIFRQMGLYAARILKGEKPSDLPIEQPARIALTINLKTAGALGLTVPQSLLSRAGKVIE
jgi:putative ABC transport system substrate-binding protein